MHDRLNTSFFILSSLFILVLTSIKWSDTHRFREPIAFTLDNHRITPAVTGEQFRTFIHNAQYFTVKERLGQMPTWKDFPSDDAVLNLSYEDLMAFFTYLADFERQFASLPSWNDCNAATLSGPHWIWTSSTMADFEENASPSYHTFYKEGEPPSHRRLEDIGDLGPIELRLKF